MQTVPFELAIKRAPAYAKHTRGDRLISTHLRKGSDDVLALDLDQGGRLMRHETTAEIARNIAGFVRQFVNVSFGGVDRFVQAGETRRQHHFALRSHVPKGAQHVEAGDAGSDERQDGTVIVDNKKTGGTLSLHVGSDFFSRRRT
jgi:hypothetical protein